MRVCVLGHRGMLGHVVARYLSEQGCEVSVIDQRFAGNNPTAFINEILSTDSQWCINCIGVKSSPLMDRQQMFETNALLPKTCAEALSGTAFFLHASTDGVFRPDVQNRSVNEQPDATDDYGVSKRQGEQSVIDAHGIVMRCSIVGPELGRPRSLFGWFSQQSGDVNGYLNHSWNGVTTLEWAKICRELIDRPPETNQRVHQPGFWPPISKCEVIQTIARLWNLDVVIRAVDAKQSVTRTLVPSLLRPDLGHQLEDLKAWY